MNTEEERIADTSVVLGATKYKSTVDQWFKNIEFRGKRLDQWVEELSLGRIDDTIDAQQAKTLNVRMIQVSRIVYQNLSYARTDLKVCQMRYKSGRDLIIKNILNKAGETKRPPGQDTLKAIADRELTEEILACDMAEMFVEFWESQSAMVKIQDGRIQGIGYIIGSEERYR